MLKWNKPTDADEQPAEPLGEPEWQALLDAFHWTELLEMVGIGLQFWLNILLTLLGYIPGIIHAVWIILRR